MSNQAALEESATPEPEATGDGDGIEAEPAEPQPDLPLDVAFELLQNERRRHVLDYLADADDPVTLGELAEELAARENDIPIEEVTSSQRKRVYVGLYQCHLPKMDDADVVDFDSDRGTIALAHNASELDRFLERTTATPRPWHIYYGGIAAGAIALYVTTQLGLTPIQLAAGQVVAVVIAAFFLCAIVHAVVEGDLRDHLQARLVPTATDADVD